MEESQIKYNMFLKQVQNDKNVYRKLNILVIQSLSKDRLLQQQKKQKTFSVKHKNTKK